MIHLGDITKINGAEIEPVDCITGGSPCQDLSVAGKRAGLAGERSGLFMEQIRVVKEMRERDRSIGRSGVAVRPRSMVWENVPGAFSSNRGEDFQVVLTEIVRIVEPEAPDVPMPDKGWPKAGCLYDAMGRWSVAWRLHDAQFWGVAQRRKRISLVADFGGMSAPEILFERKGLSRDTEPCGAAGESSAGAVEDRSGTASGFDGYNGVLTGEKEATIGVNCGMTTGRNGAVAYCVDQQGGKGGANYSVDVGCPLLSDSHGTPHAVAYNIGSYNSNAWLSDNPNSGVYETDKCKTLDALNCASPTCNQGGTAGVQRAVYAIGNGQADQTGLHELVGALNCMHAQQAVYIPEVSKALKNKANCDFREDSETYPVINSIVRRLTPLECERLQGFPDGWTDIGEWTDSKGKRHKPSDTPRYKALGNSIAVGYANHRSGFWCWLMKRISAQYERAATLGSLFDGIGGFPLAWEAVNGKGSARWASEIEEFPIAVTKYHFPEE